MTSKILIVDDEANLRKTLAEILRARGYEILEADDGTTAVELLRETRPDLIFSDWKMPKMGGEELLQHLQSNPAQRRRGKGRKGRRRIELHERAEKAWPTPLQALLIAERCAALSGCDTDFVMIITVAYTGMRWSEVIGLGPDCIQDDHVDVSWKLYELNGRFYRGRPKDGSD